MLLKWSKYNRFPANLFALHLKMTSVLLRSNFSAKCLFFRSILPGKHGLKSTYCLHQSRCKNTVKGVVFDMGGVILPSPLPAIQKAEKDFGVPEGTIQDMVVKKYSDDNGR